MHSIKLAFMALLLTTSTTWAHTDALRMERGNIDHKRLDSSCNAVPINPPTKCSKENWKPCAYGGEFCNLPGEGCPAPYNICWYSTD